MNVISSSSAIALFVGAVLLLILYNFHRYSNFLSRKTFIATDAGIVFLLFFVVWQFEKIDSPFQTQKTIVFLPLISDADEHNEFSALKYALGDALARNIKSKSDEWKAISPLTIQSVCPTDSLQNQQFLENLITKMGFEDWLGGELKSVGDSLQFELKLSHGKIIRFELKIAKDEHLFQIAHQQIAERIQAEFSDECSLNDDKNSLKLAYYQNKFDDVQRDSFHGLDSIAFPQLFQANRFFERSDYDSAYFHLQNAFENEPANSHSFELLSRFHHSRYQELGFANEVEILRHALEINPFDVDVVVRLAALEIKLDQVKQAEQILEKYAEIFPWRLDVLRALGQFYVDRANSFKIFEIYQKMLEKDPQNAEAFYNLGVYYYRVKKLDLAKGFFEKALQFGPIEDSYLYLATIAEKEGDLPSTIENLQKRIASKSGADDTFSEEARKRLYQIMLENGAVDSSGQVLKPEFLSEIKKKDKK